IALGLYLSQPIAEAIKTLTSRGIAFTGPVINDDGMLSLAFFTDPDGNSLYLAEMSQSYK
ncbi:MAG TPA: hypothetical protein VNC21_06835, partial [Vicinamibacterales bacterium]|nr:hypothetical protein [Vicinamibacterales bacterium]